MISETNIKQANRYCRDDYRTIRGYDDAVKSPHRSCIHHINELTFTSDELKKMNMYYNRPASELIWLSYSDHSKWHNKWNGNPMEGRHHSEETIEKIKSNLPDFTGSNNPMYGRRGESAPGYGRTEDKCPLWKGDSASLSAVYKRGKKLYKAGKITREEFIEYRNLLYTYRKLKK